MSNRSKNTSNYIIVGIVVVFLAFLIAGSWLYFNGFRDDTNKKGTEYLTLIASEKSAEITRWFSNIENLSRAVKNNNPINEINKYRKEKKRIEALTEWLKKTAAYFNTGSAALYDGDKKFILSTGENLIKYPEALEKGAISWNKAINLTGLSLVKSEFFADAEIPLFNDSTSVLPTGYVQLNINLTESLFKTLKPLPGYFKSENIFIMSGHKVINLKENELFNPDSLGQIKNGGQTIFSLFNKNDGSITGLDNKGTGVNSYYIKVSLPGWYIISKADIAEFDDPVKAEGIRIITFVSIVTMIFLLTTFFLLKPKRKEKPIIKEENKTVPATDEIPKAKPPEEEEKLDDSLPEQKSVENEKPEIEAEEEKIEVLPDKVPVEETAVDSLPEPEKTEAVISVIKTEEEKVVLVEAERIEVASIDDFELEKEIEIAGEDAKPLPETDIAEETKADEFPKPGGTEIPEEEIMPEVEPIEKTLVCDSKTEKETGTTDEAVQSMSFADIAEETKADDFPKPGTTEIPEEEILPEVETAEKTSNDDSKTEKENEIAEKSVKPLSATDMAEETKAEDLPVPETSEIQEEELLPEIELIEGSLNGNWKKPVATEYKKPEKEILAKLEKIKSFGLIPKILFEINLLLSKEPDNTTKLAELIIKEQSITAKLLSAANSPYYGLKKKISSVEYAILLLGREEICHLVTALSLSDMVRFPSSANLRYLDYWFHSMVVGYTSRDLARKLGFSEILNEAFLGGIFHDLGIQILAKHFPKEFGIITRQIKEGKNALDAETDTIGCTHQEIGRYAVERWGLPENIYDALSFHHCPNKSEGNKILTGIINLSDWLTHQVTQNESFWEKGLELEENNFKLLGFRSVEFRNVFLERYYPALQATLHSVQF